MLEITGNDIAELDDKDLRTLVGRLCESELRSRGLSTSAVTWGGNQNAADGGIDVRLTINDAEPPGDFIPRTSVGFQVKKTDFTPGLIGPEMRPSGQLRDSIRGLISARGAYIIVSSGSDTSDSALADRLNAMRLAVADQVGNAHLKLDFYDRNRLATWTRSHPGMIAWVRQQIGRGIPGWKPYTSWAVSPDGVKDVYLLDNKARLHMGISDKSGVDISLGIDRIRNTLRHPRSIVRLVGLSGVGKTRLVQALFDPHVGNNPLNAASVIYTDMNDNPSPQPTGMVSDLIASRTRAVIVVDNCAPSLHRRVTEVCQAADSLMSAITIEYDVQEDEPEGTEVFRLEPSSFELVSKLIARRYPNMAFPDVNRIAEFSGGNSRVALALANSLEHGESVAGLRDEELFKRLFNQRQEPDGGLMKAAQACALLYSFEGESLNGNAAELPKIAALVGMDTPQLFAKVAQLKQRDLVQRRSVWRAILPQAIANRLAIIALREIPLELIEVQFDTTRLMKSFSRRLGYLHESEEARRIVDRWLTDGLLSDLGRLNDSELPIFDNLAPVSPRAALSAIERALSEPHTEVLLKNTRWRETIGTALYSIAYDASLFDRCVAAMVPLVFAERQNERTYPIGDAIKTLFHICESGTHAPVAQRTRIVQCLLNSPESARRALGLELLGGLLETDRFSPFHPNEFGAQIRDYGYSPASIQEEIAWFAETLELARRFALKNNEMVSTIHSFVARSVRSIWFLGPEVQGQFEAIAADAGINNYWHEGWLAIRYLLSHLTEEDKKDTVAVERLRAFETRLRPRNIAERVRAVVLPSSSCAFDFAESDAIGNADNITTAYKNANAAAEELGRAVCGDQALLTTVLPELVSGDGSRLFQFGRGLAIASTNHRNLWNQLAEVFAITEESKRNGDAICGFMNGLSMIDQPHSEALLEEALTHPTLGAWFPRLQASVKITPAGVDRMKRAAELGLARAGAFRRLGWELSDAVSAHDLQSIVMSLAKQEHGYEVAVDILAERLIVHRGDKWKEREVPRELIDAGRKLLSLLDWSIHNNSHDYNLHTIANVCLRGDAGAAASISICEQIKRGLSARTFRPYDFNRLLQSIFELQPLAALDFLFGSGPETNDQEREVIQFSRAPHRQRSAIDSVPTEELLQWCDVWPATRYPAIARCISYDTSSDGRVEWTPLATEMLKRAPDPLAVLEIFVSRFYPCSWSGSRAAIVESRLGLLDRLSDLQDRSLEDYAIRVRPQLVEGISRTRKLEDQLDSERDERFE